MKSGKSKGKQPSTHGDQPMLRLGLRLVSSEPSLVERRAARSRRFAGSMAASDEGERQHRKLLH